MLKKSSNWRQRKQKKSCLLLLWMLKKVQLRRIAPKNITRLRLKEARKKLNASSLKMFVQYLCADHWNVTGSEREKSLTRRETRLNNSDCNFKWFRFSRSSNTEQKILKTKRKKKHVKRRRQQENDFWALLNSCQTGFLLSVSFLSTRSSTFPVHLNRKEMNKMKNLLIMREWNASKPL